MSSDWFLTRPEKRNYRRVDAEIDVDVVIDGHVMKATTSNISCGGLFLPLAQEQLKKKANIEVVLNLPDGERPVKVVGEVARLEDDSDGVAIKFNGLYDDNILAIDRFIKNKFH